MNDQATQLRNLVLHASRQASAEQVPAPRLIVVSGGRAGLGTTTIAVNLAVALAGHGSRTVLIDADLAHSNLAELCGANDSPGVGDVLAARRSIHEVLQLGPSGIQLAASSRSASPGLGHSDKSHLRLQRQIMALGRYADMVVLDAGSGGTPLASRLWQAADQVLLVTSGEAVAVMDSYALVKTVCAKRAVAMPVTLLVNHASSLAVAQDIHRRIDQSCCRFLGLTVPLAGYLVTEPGASKAASAGVPLILHQPTSPWSQAMDQLAWKLLATDEAAETKPWGKVA